MLARKLVCTLLLLSWLGLLLGVVGMMFTLAHHYGDAFAGRNVAIPELTRVVLLLLGNAGVDGSSHLAHRLLVISLFAVPVVVMVLVWRAEDRLAFLEVLVLGGGTYLVAVLALAAFIGFGLCLPFLSL
jgi:hypothetical protein